MRFRVLGQGAHQAVGQLEAVLEPSPERVTPACPLLSTCGSCDRMMLSARGQLQEKERQVYSQLEGLGGARLPIVPSPRPLRYRARARFVLGGKAGQLVAGAWQSGSHALIDVGDCPVTCGVLLRARDLLVQALNASGLPPYDETRGTGLLRALVLQTDEQERSILALLVCARLPPDGLDGPVLTRLTREVLQPEACGGIHGLALNLHPGRGNALTGRTTIPLGGAEVLTLTLGEVSLQVPPGAFAQVNLQAAAPLYARVAQRCVQQGGLAAGVLELYCGVGGLGLSLLHAQKAAGLPPAPFLGLEAHSGATEAAQRNAARLLEPWGPVRFEVADLAGDTPLTLPFNPACVLVNPPRGGLSEGVRRTLLTCRPPLLVYVACGPEALARDLRVLTAGGFRLEAAQPFDLFPQTRQVETLAWGGF